MWLTPIHKTASVVSNEIGAVNIASRTINTVTSTVWAVINRTSNAISNVFWGAWKILKNGLVAWWIAAAALTFPISAPAIYGALATGKFVKNKVEGKGRWESIGNAITRPLWADTVAKYTDFAKVGEWIKDMTIWAGWEVVKWAAELVTVPLIWAKFDESSNSWQVSQAVDSPSTTESPAPSSSTPPSIPEQPKKQDTPIPTPIPSNPEKPKTQKEIDAERKKEEEKQRKEEEKQKKEEIEKTVDEINKQQKTFSNKIDTAIKKVKELSDAEKAWESQERFDEQNKFLQEKILDKIPNKKTAIYSGKTFWDFVALFSASWIPGEINNISHPDEYNYIKDFIMDFKNDIINKIDDNDDLPNIWDNIQRKFENISWKRVSSSISDIVDISNDIHRKLSAWQPLRKTHIENIFYILWHSSTEDGALQWHIEGSIKDITRSKKEKIKVDPRHIEKQQDKLVDTLNKMKTESSKAVGSIVTSSRLWGKKLNKDNASDALEQLADAMNSVTEQASAGEKRIDMTKPIAGISDAYQTLLSSIQTITS
jgi:hypothetical protein